jgi:hypothetical protein
MDLTAVTVPLVDVRKNLYPSDRVLQKMKYYTVHRETNCKNSVSECFTPVAVHGIPIDEGKTRFFFFTCFRPETAKISCSLAVHPDCNLTH